MFEHKSIDLILKSLPFLLKGVVFTIQIAFLAILIGLFFGIILGVLNSKKMRVPVVAQIADFYVLIVRGTPIYVQILIFYYALPDLLHINFSPFSAGVLALGFNSIAYVAEIIRGGTNAISQGQWDACYVLGYSFKKKILKIILPQVIKDNFPALTSELTVLIKQTAILSTIGVAEMTRQAMNINARTLQPLPIYLTVALLYLILTSTISFITKKIEKGFDYDNR